MENVMKIVCAWCGEHQRGPAVASMVSHTICPSCQASVFPDEDPEAVLQAQEDVLQAQENALDVSPPAKLISNA